MSAVSPLSALARRIDQTHFLNKLFQYSPYVLGALTAGYVVQDSFKAPAGSERRKKFIKNTAVAVGTFAGAFASYQWYLRPKAHDITEVAGNVMKFFEHHGGEIFHNSKVALSEALEKLENAGRGKAKKAAEEALEDVVSGFSKKKALPDGLTKHLAAMEKGEMAIKKVQPFQAEILEAVITKGQYASKFNALPKAEQEQLISLINASKEKSLGRTQTKDLMTLLQKIQPPEETAKGKAEKLINILIPTNEAATYKEMFGEIWELSKAGFLPVAGGVAGGLTGNLLNRDKEWKSKLGTQMREAMYQFFANIMLCNIGAAGMLALVNNLPGVSKEFKNKTSTRFVAMVVGIVTMGVVFGAYISNFFGNNFIDPMMKKGIKGGWQDLRDKVKEGGVKAMTKDLFADRKPTGLDVIVHLDDLLTVGYVAGLKIIGPLLPYFYTLSGFRAGIEFRNGNGYKAAQKAAKEQAALPKTLLKTPESAGLVNPTLSSFQLDTPLLGTAVPTKSHGTLSNALFTATFRPHQLPQHNAFAIDAIPLTLPGEQPA